MARIKLAYLGGGSSRAAGTMDSFIGHGPEFDGSEVVLIDKDPEHLEIVRTIAEKRARNRGLDLTITATTDQRAGLSDVDAVLTSFRPGDFELRLADEQIPLRHGVIGQETQGPGGFMMALRSVQIFKGILADLEEVAPRARIFNYTNPVNVVSQAVEDHTDAEILSMCEGPITFWPPILRTAGLDPDRAEIIMAGVNHNCWSTTHLYDGEDIMPLLDEAWERLRDDVTVDAWSKRMLHLAVAMRSIPADYFKYYYFREEMLREQQGKRLTRAGVILESLPRYWEHYVEQAAADEPVLDPSTSRGGIHELELAIDVMSAYYNDKTARLPVNLLNTGGLLPGFDDDTVVEVWCDVDGRGAHPIEQKPLPHAVRGITQTLAEYQRLAAVAAWDGDRADAVRALVAHPFVPTLAVAEELYDDMAHANRDFLPERLLR
jgi:6-phospho-beta-glucosidase